MQLRARETRNQSTLTPLIFSEIAGSAVSWHVHFISAISCVRIRCAIRTYAFPNPKSRCNLIATTAAVVFKFDQALVARAAPGLAGGLVLVEFAVDKHVDVLHDGEVLQVFKHVASPEPDVFFWVALFKGLAELEDGFPISWVQWVAAGEAKAVV